MHCILECPAYAAQFWELVEDMLTTVLKELKKDAARCYLSINHIMYNKAVDYIPRRWRQSVHILIQECKREIYQKRVAELIEYNNYKHKPQHNTFFIHCTQTLTALMENMQT